MAAEEEGIPPPLAQEEIVQREMHGFSHCLCPRSGLASRGASPAGASLAPLINGSNAGTRSVPPSQGEPSTRPSVSVPPHASAGGVLEGESVCRGSVALIEAPNAPTSIAAIANRSSVLSGRAPYPGAESPEVIVSVNPQIQPNRLSLPVGASPQPGLKNTCVGGGGVASMPLPSFFHSALRGAGNGICSKSRNAKETAADAAGGDPASGSCHDQPGSSPGSIPSSKASGNPVNADGANGRFTFKREGFILSFSGSLSDYYEVESKKLGKGTYGSVSKAVNKATRTTRAVKTISKARVRNVKRFKQEIAIMKSLDHPNIM